jgi:hypothetical protein
MGEGMDKEKTTLAVPPDAWEHAKRFGAKRDRETGIWFVVGPVPGELQNYVPRLRNAHFQEHVPRCPLCGAKTRKSLNRNGALYWECAKRAKSGCRGALDYRLDYKGDEAPAAIINSSGRTKAVGKFFGGSPLSPAPTRKTAHPLRVRWIEIVKEAATAFGGAKQAAGWLERPNAAFDHRAPIRILGTEEGCDAILKFLRDAQQ